MELFEKKLIEQEDLFETLGKATNPKKKILDAYNAGYDCGLNGNNTINCHFSFFATPELTNAHSQGVRDAKDIKLKKPKKPPQWKQVLAWLQAGKSITDLEALRMFDCRRLSGRIYDLKKKGYNIETEMIRTSTGKWIAKYKLN